MNEHMKTGIASLQWFFFIFANTIVVPVSIGTAFDLSSADIAMTLKSSLIVTGIACVLQGLWGHRYPLMEGHSGLMWGLFLNISASAAALNMDLQTIGGAMATGILASGLVMVVIGGLGLVPWLKKIFTPMVMSVYLFLLAIQLVIIFFGGMLKLTPSGGLDVPVSLFSVAIAVLVGVLKVKGKGALSNFSILIGIVAGWILYRLLFQVDAIPSSGSASFSLFPLGKPNLEWGIIITTFVACLLNMSNTITAVQAASSFYKEEPTNKQFNRSFSLTGIYTALTAPLGLVPYAPFASSLGFLESTRIFDRRPFIIGGLLFSVLGLIPAAGDFFATLPITVGNAVLFIAYLQLFGTALQSLQGTKFNSNTIFRIAVPVLVGISLMTLDPVIFSTLPIFLQPLISNGLMVGVVLSIILELFVRWEKV
ncbi:uracil/xanthine transporter [Bacillus sp. REN10]|uniref:uracil/xanthine transporter n=1 Tax=Bacillus sp. REN10 TaxID=2782541 RepID=UPI00193B63F9|nr:uracil/xanthine transporter [Bacillus sp. REN10]